MLLAELMNENINIQIASLLKLKINSFKTELKKKKELTEKRFNQINNSEFLEGQVYAYNEVTKLVEQFLKDVK